MFNKCLYYPCTAALLSFPTFVVQLVPYKFCAEAGGINLPLAYFVTFGSIFPNSFYRYKMFATALDMPKIFVVTNNVWLHQSVSCSHPV